MVHWFQGSFPDGCLGDEVLTGDLSLGLISEILGGVVIVSSQVFGHLRSFKGWIQTEACVIPNYHGMLIIQKHRNNKTISVAVVPSRNNPG